MRRVRGSNGMVKEEEMMIAKPRRNFGLLEDEFWLFV